MGSGSSVSAPPAPETRQLQTNMSVTSGYPLSDPELQPSNNHSLRMAPDSELFTPDDELEGGGASTSLQSRVETNVRSAVASSLSERPPLSEDQESKITTCLTSLEKHLQDLELRFDRSNILIHARVVQLEGGEGIEVFDHVGEGLFVVDSGTVDLVSSGTDTADSLPVIRLIEGDYCGEYSTIFNISFRIKAQFKTSVTLLHLPAEIVRVNMHYTGQLDREAMLKLSIIQSNLLSGECFGEDISSRVVTMCLKASSFSSLGEDALGYLADTVVPLLFTTADVVYNEGEIATYVFLVLRGMVQLVQRGQIHTTHKVSCSSEGVSLAIREFFEGTVLSHQAVAAGPLLLGAIGREQILDMLNKFPESAAAVRRVVQRQ